MERIKRISVSIPEILFKEFENVREIVGEKKRSRAVAEALYEYISVNRWTKLEGDISGVMIVCCRRDKEMNFLFDVENAFVDVIKSSFHVRIDSLNYLWIFVFSGHSERVKKLAREMGKRKCIKGVRIFTIHA